MGITAKSFGKNKSIEQKYIINELEAKKNEVKKNDKGRKDKN